MSKAGKFITIEGTEGVGKSTNIAFITQWLSDKGIEIMHSREPGGTPLAEEIRELLLNKRDEQVDSRTELLLMFAARCQHVSQKIRPALDAGHWVLSDRFTDASYAYQGAGRELGFERLEELDDWSLQGFKPDLTIMLDLPIEIGLERAEQRGEKDRFESEQIEFFKRVRDGYLAIAKAEPERMKVIDATGSIKQVQQQIEKVLSEFYQVNSPAINKAEL
ncbi:dTMP kinase [Kangiella sp. HZ709]|uniref:dTMP kinase n=1 Tax=Kangiella sp. HZ709 TaxID=2666328 RepID=UPI0012AF7C54|nr:dTMP kinase [Kangiella sp. HZ709]MRX26899.1 dTMP kinase [Kangiella sp. HZ709]